MQYCDVITNPRWLTAAILKIAKSPYLSEKSSDFDEIWYTIANIEPDESHMTKIKIYKIQDGGGGRLENRFFGHQPIVRFHRNFVRGSKTACQQRPRDKNCTFLKSKMADAAAILKIVKPPYLSEKKLSDFDEMWCTTADSEPDDSHMTKN